MAVKKSKKTTKPKTAKTPKTTKTTNKNHYTLDRESGRWRNNGRYCKPPKKTQLRQDVKGRPIDGMGRRVPVAAIAPTKAPAKPRKPAPKASPKTAPKASPRAPKPPRKRPAPARVPAPARPPRKPRPPKVRQHRIKKGRIEFIPDGGSLTDRKVLSSTFENVEPPTKAGEILFKVIGKINRKKQRPESANEMPLYRYGVTFTNTAELGDEWHTEQLVIKLATEYPNFSFQFNANNVNVWLGDTNTPIGRHTAQTDLADNESALADMHAYLYDLWDGELGWFVIAENDEESGGS
jgi:hypothetical protein